MSRRGCEGLVEEADMALGALSIIYIDTTVNTGCWPPGSRPRASGGLGSSGPCCPARSASRRRGSSQRSEPGEGRLIHRVRSQLK